MLATVALNNGVATYQLPRNTPAGSYSIVAHYNGNARHQQPTPHPVTITVEQATR